MRGASGWRDWSEPSVRDRPIGLMVLALASAVGSLIVTLAALELFLSAAAYADWMVPKIVGNGIIVAWVYPEHYLLVGTILLIPAGFLLALFVGVLRARPWAWLLAVILGGLGTAYGLLALVIPADAGGAEQRWHPEASLSWIVLGVGLLWYLDRRPVRADLGWGDSAIG